MSTPNQFWIYNLSAKIELKGFEALDTASLKRILMREIKNNIPVEIYSNSTVRCSSNYELSIVEFSTIEGKLITVNKLNR